MARFSVEADTLSLGDTNKFSKGLQRTIRREAESMVTRHSLDYQRGKGPGGASQKRYTSKYRKRKQDAGFSPQTTLLVGGSLLNSRATRNIPKGVEVGFQGTHIATSLKPRRATKKGGSQRSHPTVRRVSGNLSNAQLARFLKDKGYKIHFISKNDDRIITDNVSKFLDGASKDLVRIKKGR